MKKQKDNKLVMEELDQSISVGSEIYDSSVGYVIVKNISYNGNDFEVEFEQIGTANDN